MLTYTINVKLKKGGVFGSALIVMVSGLLYKFYLEQHFPGIVATFPAVATTASYAGMVSEKYVKNIWQMGIVGLIAGTLFFAGSTAFSDNSEAWFRGVGGTLGTIAAIACFAFISINKLYTRYVIPKNSSCQNQATQ